MLITSEIVTPDIEFMVIVPVEPDCAVILSDNIEPELNFISISYFTALDEFIFPKLYEEVLESCILTLPLVAVNSEPLKFAIIFEPPPSVPEPNINSPSKKEIFAF